MVGRRSGSDEAGAGDLVLLWRRRDLDIDEMWAEEELGRGERETYSVCERRWQRGVDIGS